MEPAGRLLLAGFHRKGSLGLGGGRQPYLRHAPSMAARRVREEVHMPPMSAEAGLQVLALLESAAALALVHFLQVAKRGGREHLRSTREEG